MNVVRLADLRASPADLFKFVMERAEGMDAMAIVYVDKEGDVFATHSPMNSGQMAKLSLAFSRYAEKEIFG